MFKGIENEDYLKYKVNHRFFTNCDSPESAYILGLLWADGYILPHRNRTEITLIFSDYQYIENIFKRSGKWGITIRNRKDRQKSITLTTHNPYLCNFLLENDYKAKSHLSADKILSLIPEYLKHYWFLGLLDGDGSLNVNRKQGYSISIYSSYQQDWHFLEQIAEKLNIKFYIWRGISKNSKSSTFRIGNIKDCIVFAKYIYQNTKQYDLGFVRKRVLAEKLCSNKKYFYIEDEKFDSFRQLCFSYKQSPFAIRLKIKKGILNMSIVNDKLNY